MVVESAEDQDLSLTTADLEGQSHLGAGMPEGEHR